MDVFEVTGCGDRVEVRGGLSCLCSEESHTHTQLLPAHVDLGVVSGQPQAGHSVGTVSYGAFQ